MRFTTPLLVASLTFSSVLSAASSEPRLLRRSGGLSAGGAARGEAKKGIFSRLLDSLLTKLMMSGMDESRRINSELPHASELDLEEWEEERLADAQRRRFATRRREADFDSRRHARRHRRSGRRRLERRQFLPAPALQWRPQELPTFSHQPFSALPTQSFQAGPPSRTLSPGGSQNHATTTTGNAWAVKQPVHFRTFAGRTYMYDAISATWLELTPRLARMLMTDMAYNKWLQLNQGANPLGAPLNTPAPGQPRFRHTPTLGIPQPVQNPTNPWRSPSAPSTPPGMNDAKSPRQGADILTRTMTYLNAKAAFKEKQGGKYGKREEYLHDEIYGRI